MWCCFPLNQTDLGIYSHIINTCLACLIHILRFWPWDCSILQCHDLNLLKISALMNYKRFFIVHFCPNLINKDSLWPCLIISSGCQASGNEYVWDQMVQESCKAKYLDVLIFLFPCVSVLSIYFFLLFNF